MTLSEQISDETFRHICEQNNVSTHTIDACIAFMKTKNARNSFPRWVGSTKDESSTVIQAAVKGLKIQGADQDQIIAGAEIIRFVVESIPDNGWDCYRLLCVYRDANDQGGCLTKPQGNEISKNNFLASLEQVPNNKKWTILDCFKDYTRQGIIPLDGELSSGEIRARLRLQSSLDKVKFQLDKTTESGAEEYIADLVQVDPVPSADNLQMKVDHTKSQVILVSGESGSGKTWFVKHGLRKVCDDYKYLFYYSLGRDDVGSAPPKADSETTKARDFLKECLAVVRTLDGNTEWEKRLYSALSQTAQTRNDWAEKVILRILDKGMSNNSLRSWWEFGMEPLPTLAIVLDEVGRSSDFVAGIVDIGRTFIGEHLIGRKKAERAAIVLVGADLDSLNKGEEGLKFFGTDPDKSFVFTMETPVPENLGDKNLAEAIGKGTYSSIVGTNARMLMRGVVPVMRSSFVMEGYADEKLKEQRIAIGCLRPIMDYGVRLYPTLNGLASVNKPFEKSELIKAAFWYMWKEGVEEARAMNSQWQLSEFIENLLSREEWAVSSGSIFTVGLVRRKAKATSPALKFLACGGLSAPVYLSNGISFEDMVVLHLRRLFEVAEFEVFDYRLKAAWPEAIAYISSSVDENKTKKDSAAATLKEDAIRRNTERLKLIPAAKDDIEEIATKLQLARQYRAVAVVTRQTVSNAQGPDVIVCHYSVEENEVKIALVQCKHYKRVPTVQEVVSTLGLIDDKQTSRLVIAPEKEIENVGVSEPEMTRRLSAIYSRRAMDVFIDELKERMNRNSLVDCGVSVSLRAVALSATMENLLKTNERRGEKAEKDLRKILQLCNGDPETNSVVWCREFFEPTWSACNVHEKEETMDYGGDGGKA